MKIRSKFARLFIVLAMMAGIVPALVSVSPVHAIAAADVIGATSSTDFNAPTTAGAAAQWSVQLHTAAGTVVGGVGTISVTFPTGVSVPASISGTLINVTSGTVASTTAVVSSTGGNTTVTGSTVSIVYPVITNSSGAPLTLGASSSTVITFSQLAGIKNPNVSATAASLTYRIGVATSAETTVATAASGFLVTGFVNISPSAGATGGAITVTGGGFSPTSSINLTGGVIAQNAGIVASDGTFSISNFIAQGAAVTATDGTGRTAASAAIALLPRLSLSSTTVNAGDTTTFTMRETPGIAGADEDQSPNLTGGSLTTSNGGYDSILIGGASSTTPVISSVTSGNRSTSTGTSGAGARGIYPVDTDNDGNSDDIVASIRIPSNTVSGATTLLISPNATSTGPGQVATGTPSSVSFTVRDRTVTLSPTSGPPGTLITVTGAGFPSARAAGSGQTITCTGCTTVTTWGTDSAGGFQQVITTATTGTGANPGSLTITSTVTGADTLTSVKSATFTVTAATGSLSVSPASGPRGTTVSVTGSNFTGGASLTTLPFIVNGTFLGSLSPATVSINGGTLTASSGLIPSSTAYGTVTVFVQADNGVQGFTAFTVTQPTIALSSATGNVGSAFTVSGANWLSNSGVTITVAAGGTTLLTGTAVPNSGGAISQGFTVPSTAFNAGAANTLTVSATDNNGNVTLTQTFTVNAAGLTVTPASAAAGTSATVAGTGFLPTTALTTLTIGGANVLPGAPVITDGNGAFTTAFSVPGLIGAQTVSATVGSTTRTTPITITSGSTSGAVAVATAFSGFTGTTLQLASSFNYTTSKYEAYVPGLPGNPLTQVSPNSVIILTLNATRTVVVSGVSFTVNANTPTPLPVGATVTITVQ